MSNPLKSISIPSIARAVSNTLALQRQHKEHKTQTELRKRASSISTNPVERVDSNKITEAQIKCVALELLPAAEQLLAKNPLIGDRGYFATHRSIGHLLPAEYKWTVAGVRIVNAILNSVPTVSGYMEKWSNEIEAHMKETEADENEKRQRKQKYDNENLDTLKLVCDELDRLKSLHDNRRLENYHELFNYLRNGLPRYFRGARGVRLIHEAFRMKLEFWTAWSIYMQADLEEAVRRDTEYKKARYENNRSRARHVNMDAIPGESITQYMEDGYVEEGEV